MAGKYSAGAIIAAMPLKSGKSSMPAMKDDGTEGTGDEGDGKSDTPVCKISKDDLDKLNNGESITYSGPDGDMTIEVEGDDDEEAGESKDEEAAEDEETEK